ncbi:adenosine deaminase [Saxibacter everestensis]|uniref:adenosine deaminase n=1 Tax=Saxibacter everestensis TaxID=2909229 RepID=A0ABY8QPF6_9MICO|nr:adenosine deaminase [Brevibacteriaceae bacterium ZFBP1038]
MTSHPRFPTPFGVDPHDPLLALPKVSLHDHLDGGLRPQTIIELADEIGYQLPSNNAGELQLWFRDACDSGDLVRYLETFDHTTALMQTHANLHRVATEWVLDQVADGVIYAEARWAPEQHLAGGLSLDEAVDAVQAGLDAGVAEAALEGKTIVVGQLITAMRHADRSVEIAELALRHRDAGAVGFDIAGAELGFPASNHREAFELLHRENFPVTIHAGEADGVLSVWEAVQLCNAQRIGHGVRLIEDCDLSDPGNPRLGRLAQWVRDRHVPLELCPSSNVQTAAAPSIAEHPITWFKNQGFTVALSPDNRLMSGTSMTREMRLLMDEAGWDHDDLLWVSVNALQNAFLDLPDREALLDELLLPGFEGSSV